MSTICPAPSASRGEVILQPTYFTSSIFVKALRQDINNLLITYVEQFSNTQTPQPFALFKTTWCSQGWQWMHFMVFDNRARESFLDVISRLFLGTSSCAQVHFYPFTRPINLERVVESETLLRAVALFGFYTFYYTQPTGTAPVLSHITRIAIPLGAYNAGQKSSFYSSFPRSLHVTQSSPEYS